MVLSTADIRQTLHTMFARLGRFRVGEMADTSEVLEAILEIIHLEHMGINVADRSNLQFDRTQMNTFEMLREFETYKYEL